jgi:Uncharacterised protein family (UPF0160)
MNICLGLRVSTFRSQSLARPVRSLAYFRFLSMSSEQPVTKRLKTSSDNLVIGTHNGTFHCDEALAVFLLHQTPKYKDASALCFFCLLGV